MTLPEAFVRDLVTLCRRFIAENRLPTADADILVGRAGRVAHVLPLTRPFVSSLYAALSAALEAASVRTLEAGPGRVACRRFRHGARMLVRILTFSDSTSPVPNCRDVHAVPPPAPAPEVRRIEVDASPWGGGAVLIENGVPSRCFACQWHAHDFRGKKVKVGEPSSQTFFEILALVLAIERWCPAGSPPTAIWGDNVAALQETINMRGKGPQEALAQALAVLRGARSLQLAVGHLPSESNTLADHLSRLFAPGSEAKQWPFQQGSSVARDVPLSPRVLWSWLK